MPSGPGKSAHRSSSDILSLSPFGVGGVDQSTSENILTPDILRRGENLRSALGPCSRRLGAQKVYRASQVGAARFFGADTKYAKITANAELLIPLGGFFLSTHFVAQEGAGDTYILANRQPSQTYGVVWLVMSSTRTLSASVRWSSGSTTTITTSVLTLSATYHALLVYDDILGTLTLYLNGAVAATATPGTGLQPAQTAGIDWYIGVEWNPSAGPAAVTAGSAYLGDIDGLVLGTLKGIRPASGDSTFLAMLLKWSKVAWPAPQADYILGAWDMDEASGTTMYDRSWHLNHGTYVGSPTVTTALALSTTPANYIGNHDTPLGKRINVFAAGGNLLYQNVREET